MLARLEQSRNKEPPIEVTLLGIVKLVRLVQSLNALLPIEILPHRLSGIVMLVRLVQPRNALLPIEVTPSGIVMLVTLEHP